MRRSVEAMRGEQPDPHLDLFDFVESSTARLSVIYNNITFMQKMARAQDRTQWAKLAAEVAQNNAAVTNYLQACGGLPIRYTDTKNGEDVTAVLIGCRGFDLNTQTWEMASQLPNHVNLHPGLGFFVSLQASEIREGYLKGQGVT